MNPIENWSCTHIYRFQWMDGRIDIVSAHTARDARVALDPGLKRELDYWLPIESLADYTDEEIREECERRWGSEDSDAKERTKHAESDD